MSQIEVEFVEDGEWMDEANKPIFKVKAGQVLEVSARLARILADSGKGILLNGGSDYVQKSNSSVGDLSEREADLVAREIALDDALADLEQREKALVEHEKALVECQESLTEREKDLAERDKNTSRRKPGPKPKAES